MKAVDHFLSILERNFSPNIQDSDLQFLRHNFYTYSKPIIGSTGSASLFEYWRKNYLQEDRASFMKLGYLAAFLMEEYEAVSMPLDQEDFLELRDTLNDAAEEMNMDVLTSLMSMLVSSGYL